MNFNSIQQFMLRRCRCYYSENHRLKAKERDPIKGLPDCKECKKNILIVHSF